MVFDPLRDRLRALGVDRLIDDNGIGALARKIATGSSALHEARNTIAALEAPRAAAASLGLGMTPELSAALNAGRFSDAGRAVAVAKMERDRLLSQVINPLLQFPPVPVFPEHTVGISLNPFLRSTIQEQMEAASYHARVVSWIDGSPWIPSIQSPLSGLNGAQATALNEMLETWRHRPGFTETFTRLAATSDAMIATRCGVDSVTSLIGDVRSLAFTNEFLASTPGRLRAYQDIGFDTTLLKPDQSSLLSMLALNGYDDPTSWRLFDISPPRRVSMPDQLKALRPSRLQAKAYREVGALELWLRQFIDAEMSYFYGDDWYMARAPKTLRGRIARVLSRENCINGMLLLNEADFDQYRQIILHDEHWPDVFCHAFGDYEQTMIMLDLFKSLRTIVAHYKGFSKADEINLRVVSRWFKACITMQ